MRFLCRRRKKLPVPWIGVTVAAMAPARDTTRKMIGAGLLTWLVPGAGHWALGHRNLATVFFLAISFPYWTGLAIGGIKNQVNPWSNPWLFLAEMGAGGYTSICLIVNQLAGDLDPRNLADPKYLSKVSPQQRAEFLKYMSYYPESDVSQIYLATAGLLNILAILDALSRAQTGQPTFDQQIAPAGSRP